MASNGTRRRACDQVVGTARRLGKGDGAALRELLPVERVERAVAAEGVKFRRCLFTPLLTLWTFLGQVLDPDRSCRNAVQKLLAFLAVGGVPWGGGRGPDEQDPCGPDTGPYCKARARLPEALVSRLAKESGEDLHRRLPSGRLLGGRPVKVVDGTTCSMPDTAENQKAWPQPPTQKPGLGFPLVRLVAVLSLNCAAVLGLAIGPYAGKQSGETALLRGLLESDPDALRAGDVLLADRYYASYWMLALLRGRGVDGVFRQHQLRATDFRRGRRLGREDHVVVWRKPEQRPEWMDQAAYEQVPAELTVREVRVRVTQRGFRVRSLVLATTLLDAAVYGKQDLAEAFRCRWHVELDLRSIKRTMGMSVLRCKTPAIGAEGNLDAPAGLQPDPHAHGPGGTGGGRRAAAGELRRRGAGPERLRSGLAVGRPTRPAAAVGDPAAGDRPLARRQPAGPLRAPRRQAQGQAHRPAHGPAPTGTRAAGKVRSFKVLGLREVPFVDITFFGGREL
jgi:hypothetical protein